MWPKFFVNGLVVIVGSPLSSESDLYLYEQDRNVTYQKQVNLVAFFLPFFLTSKNILGLKDNFRYFLNQNLKYSASLWCSYIFRKAFN